MPILLNFIFERKNTCLFFTLLLFKTNTIKNIFKNIIKFASLTLSNIDYQQTTNDNFVLASINNPKKNKVVRDVDPSPSFSGTYIVPFEQTFRGKVFL